MECNAKTHQNYIRIAHRRRYGHVYRTWYTRGLKPMFRKIRTCNNKYMSSYDTSEESSYLMYFDVNNLYGWAMCQPLPHAKFNGVEDIVNFYVSSFASDSPTGYILEVDLEYPQRLHDIHANLPFGPTRAKPLAAGRTSYSRRYMISSVTLFIIATCSSARVTVFVLQRYTACFNSLNPLAPRLHRTQHTV